MNPKLLTKHPICEANEVIDPSVEMVELKWWQPGTSQAPRYSARIRTTRAELLREMIDAGPVCKKMLMGVLGLGS